MDQTASHAYIGGMTIGTRIFTWLNGRVVGRDAEGNVYYEDKRGARSALGGHTRPRRWVLYDGGLAEPTRVPPEWHAWLHYITDAPLLDGGRKPWQKPHAPNATGTPASYRPPGHDYSGGQRAPASGDYESWTPDS
jgi:NADH:ubiquinone oxidoreductase subunit